VTVLAAIQPDDVVLEIGAGDLRLALRIAEQARQVIAWEIQPELIRAAVHGTAASITDNDCSRRTRDPAGAKPASNHGAGERLIVVCTDARSEPMPPGVTVAVLLMRHCTHYALYVDKLRAAGCRRLITNARWGVEVEVIDLAPAAPFASVEAGWYACRRCGATGWAGDDETALNETSVAHVADVEGCPACGVRVT
jgi:hypothetical protein